MTSSAARAEEPHRPFRAVGQRPHAAGRPMLLKPAGVHDRGTALRLAQTTFLNPEVQRLAISRPTRT